MDHRTITNISVHNREPSERSKLSVLERGMWSVIRQGWGKKRGNSWHIWLPRFRSVDSILDR